MRIEESFVVPAPLKTTWLTLTNMELVYGCLPGAEISEVAEDRCSGTLRMKIGPIATSYSGAAHFELRDEAKRLIVIAAEGADKRGRGTAKASMRALLAAAGPEETKVEMVNDVQLTGRVAQFGRGVIGDVSREMLGEFAANLAAMVGDRDALDQSSAVGEHPAAAEAAPQSAAASQPTINMLAVGARIARRRAPYLLVAAGVIAAMVLLVARL